MYDYNSLQITIDSNIENPSVLSKIIYLQHCIPKDLIYDEPGYGIETDPHITVLYGFKSDKSLGKLKSKIGSISPFLVKLTGLGVFEKPEYDVVYLSVNSDKLYEINSWIRKNCDVQVTYPNYTPHLTLAYVAPGFGEYIKEVLGKRFKQETLKVITMDWSNTKGEKEKINMKIDPVQFWKGMNVEVGHGDVNSKTDVVPNINGSDDLEVIGKISLAHLMELPDYYDRLEDMGKVESIMYQSPFTKFNEFTISDFKGQMTRFTKKFRKERDRIRGVESKVAIVANVKKKGDDLTIYFLTLPTYDDQAEEVPNVRPYPPKFKKTPAYTIVILVKDFFKIKTKRISDMKVKDLRNIFKVADVKFHNTSPAFFLQGYAYNLTQIDSSIKKVSVPPTVWGPRTNNGILDKHVGGIVEGFDRFLPDILKQLKQKVKRSKYYQK